MDSVTFSFSLLLAFRLGRIDSVPHTPYNKCSEVNDWRVLEERSYSETSTTVYKLSILRYVHCRCRCPRCLRWWSAACSLVWFRFRIPPEHGGLSVVSVVFCQVEVSATGWTLVQRRSTKCGVPKRVWKWRLDRDALAHLRIWIHWQIFPYDTYATFISINYKTSHLA